LGRWTAERWAASSGIAFAIILVVSQFLAGTPPHYNASPNTIVAFLNDHHNALIVQGILGGVLIVLFLWFLASFAGMYREAGQNRLATIMYGSGVALVAIAAIGDAVGLAVTQLRGTIDPNTVQGFYAVSIFFYLKLMWPAAALALACSIANHRSHLLPEWYRVATLCGCLVFIIGGLSVRMHGFFSPAGAMGWIAMLTFAGWVLVSSWLCMQRHAVAHAVPHAAMSH
jgi:hypothetical protein